LGLLLWNTFIFYMSSSQALFWCFVLGLALIFGILALVFFDPIIISATALVGAYVFVYGIGIVAGGFQNPFTIASEIEAGIQIDNLFYAYMAGIVVMTIIGVIIQCISKKHEQDFKHPYHSLR